MTTGRHTIGSGHTTGSDTDSASVVAMRRPPVRQATLVRSDRQHTFEVFVRTIGAWWPVQPFSAGGQQVRDVTVEERVGGRVYETWADGTAIPWGQIRVWQPPERFVMSWLGTPAPTEVELSFAVLGANLTRVAVEHRGWEALTEAQLCEDCALPGGYAGGAYHRGWASILGYLPPAVETTSLQPQDRPPHGACSAPPVPHSGDHRGPDH